MLPMVDVQNCEAVTNCTSIRLTVVSFSPYHCLTEQGCHGDIDVALVMNGLPDVMAEGSCVHRSKYRTVRDGNTVNTGDGIITKHI